MDLVALDLHLGWSKGDKDRHADRLHDRTYARFILKNSWESPVIKRDEIENNFQRLLESPEFLSGGSALLYIGPKSDSVEVFIEANTLKFLAHINIGIVVLY